MRRSTWYQSVVDGQPLFSLLDGSPVVAALKTLVLNDEARRHAVAELSDSVYAQLLVADGIRDKIEASGLTGMQFMKPEDYHATLSSLLNLDGFDGDLLRGGDISHAASA